MQIRQFSDRLFVAFKRIRFYVWFVSDFFKSEDNTDAKVKPFWFTGNANGTRQLLFDTVVLRFKDFVGCLKSLLCGYTIFVCDSFVAHFYFLHSTCSSVNFFGLDRISFGTFFANFRLFFRHDLHGIDSFLNIVTLFLNFLQMTFTLFVLG